MTLAVNRRAKVFDVEEYCEIIVDSIKYYSHKYKLSIEGYVIMWDHLHLLVGYPMKFRGKQPLLRANLIGCPMEPRGKQPLLRANLIGSARSNGSSPGLNPIIQSFLLDFKGYTGYNIIQLMKKNHDQNLQLLKLNKPGMGNNFFRLWQKKWYIKVIQNEKQYYQVIEYIKNNPAMAGYDLEFASQNLFVMSPEKIK